jgi:hypothetical protein
LDRLREELEGGRYAPAALFVAMGAAAIYLLCVTWHAGFYLDEWGFIYDRLGFGADSLFRPYADNLIAVPMFAYQIAFNGFGLGAAHVPIRLLWVGTVLAASWLLFVYLSQRTLAWFALIPCSLLLVLGAGSQDQATTLGFVRMSSIATGLGALVALDRRSLRGDVLAAALLLISLFAFSAALPFVVGVAVTVFLRGSPDAWRRAWVWAAPLGGYLVWMTWAQLADYGGAAELSNLGKAPSALYHGVSGVLSALGGRFLVNAPGQVPVLDTDAGAPVAILLAIGVTLAALLRRFPREALVGLSMVAAYWIIVALVSSPARHPTDVRYLYEGAVLLTIAIAPFVPRHSPPLLAWAAIVVAFVAFSLVPNIRALTHTAQNVEEQTDENRAALAAIELDRDSIPADYDPVPALPASGGVLLYLPRTAGEYLDIVDRHGSPSFNEQELSELDDPARRVADTVLVSALDLRLEPASGQALPGGGPHCAPLPAKGVVTAQPGERLEIAPRGHSRVEVLASRFSDTPSISLGRNETGRNAILTIPRDELHRPWRLRVRNARSVRSCAGQGSSA